MAGLTADNFVQGVSQAIMTAPVSLFGAGLLPEGELEFRGLKQEWNDAWKMKDAGDDKAITAFFDEHPEYEAYLAKGKKPEERLRSFLVGSIWDSYMALGATDRKAFTADAGEIFKQSFLDTETRSYDALDINQLVAWNQMLGSEIPKTDATAAGIADPAAAVQPFDPAISEITDAYYKDRAELYPKYYEEQAAYFLIPEADKSRRLAYLTKHPDLKKYWDWNKAWKEDNPDLVDIANNKVFKRIDVAGWPQGLVDYVTNYAYTGERLPQGAMKALTQQWIKEGRPYGDVKAWLDAQVAPAMLYQGQ
jgi:hypothetical protein